MSTTAIEAMLDEARSMFSPRELARIEPHLRNPARPAGDARRAPFLFLPFLPERPWHEPPLAWAKLFESAFEAILEESRRVSALGWYRPYREPDAASSFWRGRWDAFYLLHSGKVSRAASRQCPQTLRCLEAVRRAEEYAFFSILRAGGRIHPHCGPWNVRVTYHFGLEIPERCRLVVNREARAWEPGRLVGFDDSFEHEAYNDTEHARTILVFTAWRPELTDVEVEVLRRFDALHAIPSYERYTRELLGEDDG
jgi:aspartate beta-hydroxylase